MPQCARREAETSTHIAAACARLAGTRLSVVYHHCHATAASESLPHLRCHHCAIPGAITIPGSTNQCTDTAPSLQECKSVKLAKVTHTVRRAALHHALNVQLARSARAALMSKGNPATGDGAVLIVCWRVCWLVSLSLFHRMHALS